jgi:hypothetical protein
MPSSHDRPQWDTDGETFDGRYAPILTRRRSRPAMRGHGPDCRSNPEVGCVCGEDERAALFAEAREAAAARRMGYAELPSQMAADHPFWRSQ